LVFILSVSRMSDPLFTFNAFRTSDFKFDAEVL